MEVEGDGKGRRAVTKAELRKRSRVVVLGAAFKEILTRIWLRLESMIGTGFINGTEHEKHCWPKTAPGGRGFWGISRQLVQDHIDGMFVRGDRERNGLKKGLEGGGNVVTRAKVFPICLGWSTSTGDRGCTGEPMETPTHKSMTFQAGAGKSQDRIPDRFTQPALDSQRRRGALGNFTLSVCLDGSLQRVLYLRMVPDKFEVLREQYITVEFVPNGLAGRTLQLQKHTLQHGVSREVTGTHHKFGL